MTFVVAESGIGKSRDDTTRRGSRHSLTIR
jgi:hypothetical protein